MPVDETTPSHEELWARDAARFTDLFGEALNTRRLALGLELGHLFRLESVELPPKNQVRAFENAFRES